jgi:hypothetical protein
MENVYRKFPGICQGKTQRTGKPGIKKSMADFPVAESRIPGDHTPDQRQFRGITSRPWKWSYKEPKRIDPSFSWKIEKIHDKTESNILILKYKLAFATYSARRIYNKMTRIWD